MLLVDKSRTKPDKKPWGLILVGALLLLSLFYFISKTAFNLFVTENEDLWFCDAERVLGDKFICKGKKFSKAKTQSNDFAFSGRYSSKLLVGEGLQYGFGVEINGFQKGDLYRASVWRYRPNGGEGTLVVSGNPESGFYKTDRSSQRSEKGWELIEIYFRIPIHQTLSSLKVYVFTNGQRVIYFDDLRVEKISGTNQELTAWNPLQLHLELDEKAMNKLQEKRRNAFHKGILETKEDDWVKGRISMPESTGNKKIDLRLKGDWLDHLSDDKWSFRIKLKGEDIWNRMRHFSIHTPKARSYLAEWILHKLWNREDILSPRYDFVQVQLNGKNLGLYAFEEHFDKILLEHQKRREGPILRYAEDGFWTGYQRQLEQAGYTDFSVKQPIVKKENAEISPFKEKQIKASPVLSQQFEIAQNLLYQYKYGLKPAEAIFDLDLMARYYAICDALGAYHGIIWHNERYYYNPVTGLLEPIGFDGFGAEIPQQTGFLGQGAFSQKGLVKGRLYDKIFYNRLFIEKYIAYLYKYSSKEYLKSFFLEIDTDLKQRQKMISREFENYQFDPQKIIAKAQMVNLLLLPSNDLSLKAYTQKQDGDEKILQVTNAHTLPVELIGYGSQDQKMTHRFQSPILLDAQPERIFREMITKNNQESNLLPDYTRSKAQNAYRNQDVLTYQDLQVGSSAKFLFYRVPGIDSVFHQKISDWKIPVNESPVQHLFKDQFADTSEYYIIDNQNIIFKKGTLRITTPVIIPAGYQVFMEAGTQIDLIQGAALISRSPVFIQGTQDFPVKIFSSDGTARGFTLLQCPERSTWKYATFDGLKNLDFKGWTLTGAVSLYESDMIMEHCIFRNNQCEDGLNVIRSDFELHHSLIQNTAGDGLDADFCNGWIKNSHFLNTTNDAMDFSGSNIMIEKCSVDGAGDKGISLGEESDASVFDTEIKNAVIGVASKDLSVMILDNIRLSNCEQGFTAYMKKPEYGGSTIIVKSYTVENIKRLHNILSGCVLQLREKKIEGS